MLIHFWWTRMLNRGTTIGIMVITPKKADKRHLKDQRPLTMMAMVYKLISKLSSEKFSPKNFDIINPQQMGFILGRYILENVSLAWLMHDWVTHNKLPTLSILLDLEKAFDKVEHN